MNSIAKTIEDFFIMNRDKFGYIHAGMFVVFLILIIIPPFLPLPSEDATTWNNFTLFARFLIWGLWFPLVLLSVIFFGRLWCGLLCPQGALSEYMSKGGLNKPIPGWMRWEGMPVVSFIIVTTLGQLIGVRDYPLPAMEILGGTMVVAAIIGFLYTSNRRTWCRYLCPIGPLLGIFSRLGAVGFERNSGDGRGCICPTFINTSTKVASSNCIECFRCVNPESQGSLHMKIRHPGLEIEEIKDREPNMWEVIFLFSATGLALGAFYWQASPFYIQYKEILGSLLLRIGLGDFIGKSGPWWLMVNYPSAGEVFNWLDFISVTTFMLIGMTFVALILFMLTGVSSIIKGKEGAFVKMLANSGYLYAPVALVSIVIGLGLIFFQSMVDFGLSKDLVRIIQMVLFAGGGIWSAYLAVRLDRGIGSALIPNVIGIGFIAYLWHMVLF